MPVNLQVVRVLFSLHGEQSFWQRRAENFLSKVHEIDRLTVRRLAYEAIGLLMVGLRSALPFSSSIEATPKYHMQG